MEIKANLYSRLNIISWIYSFEIWQVVYTLKQNLHSFRFLFFEHRYHQFRFLVSLLQKMSVFCVSDTYFCLSISNYESFLRQKISTEKASGFFCILIKAFWEMTIHFWNNFYDYMIRVIRQNWFNKHFYYNC